MNTRGKIIMSALAWIGILVGVCLVIVSLLGLGEGDRPGKKVVDDKPAPAVESREAFNARVKMSAEIASLTSHLEEMDNEIDKLTERVTYAGGAIDQLSKQLKALELKPAPKFPTRMRLDVVNYKGQMKKAVPVKPAEVKK
jgi:hypothetical protein